MEGEVLTLEGQHRLGMGTPALRGDSEGHELAGRTDGTLVEARRRQPRDELRVGDVVALPELHVGAGRGEGSLLEAATYALAVELALSVEVAHRAAVLE